MILIRMNIADLKSHRQFSCASIFSKPNRSASFVDSGPDRTGIQSNIKIPAPNRLLTHVAQTGFNLIPKTHRNTRPEGIVIHLTLNVSEETRKK